MNASLPLIKHFRKFSTWGVEKIMVQPLVSVLIPTYNQENFIAKSIESVLNQSYRNLQVVVTDDGSTDDNQRIILEYAEQYSEKIVAVLNKHNTGIPSNLNRGFSKCTGDYIALLDGDDLMFPDKIEKQVLALERNKDAVGCVHDVLMFDSRSGQILGLFSEWNRPKHEWGIRSGGVEIWFRHGYRNLPSTLMLRANACPTHGFDERLKYSYNWLFAVEVFKKGRVIGLNEVLGKYRMHESNITKSADLKNIASEENYVATAIAEYRYPELYRLIRNRKQTMLLGGALRDFKSGNKKSAFFFALSALNSGGPVNILKLLILFLLTKKYKYLLDKNKSNT